LRSVSSIFGFIWRNIWNAITQMNPIPPVTTNDARQPHRTVIAATRGGAINAPRLEPLLQMPITSVRAFFGTHVAAALANAGHAPASPTARNPRNAPRLHGPRASAVSIPAIDHHATEMLSPRPIPKRSRA